MLQKSKCNNLGLGQVVPKRIHLRAKRILITTKEVLEPEPKTVSKFHPAERVATEQQVRLMLALALEEGILAVFSHHYYSFNGEVRLQEEVGLRQFL